MKTTLYSIGYQGRSLDAFCGTLADAGVQVLVDVRAAAWSHRPQYRKTYLGNALRERNIEYVHCKIAGNPFRQLSKEAQGWQKCEIAYQDHVRRNPDILTAVASLTHGRVCALFCYEAAREQCHRGVILAAMRRQDRTIKIVDL